MHWIAPSENDAATDTVEMRSRAFADQFRANSGLKAPEYSGGRPQGPVLGLEGQIKHGGNINSCYDEPHDATGRFDFVLANPPFNDSATAMREGAFLQSEATDNYRKDDVQYKRYNLSQIPRLRNCATCPMQ